MVVFLRVFPVRWTNLSSLLRVYPFAAPKFPNMSSAPTLTWGLPPILFQYLWTFIFSSRQLGIPGQVWLAGLARTTSIVLDLVHRLLRREEQNASPSRIASYEICMNNHFSSEALFSRLRSKGYGACSTTRPGKLPQLLQEIKEIWAGQEECHCIRCVYYPYSWRALLWLEG